MAGRTAKPRSRQAKATKTKTKQIIFKFILLQEIKLLPAQNPSKLRQFATAYNNYIIELWISDTEKDNNHV